VPGRSYIEPSIISRTGVAIWSKTTIFFVYRPPPSSKQIVRSVDDIRIQLKWRRHVPSKRRYTSARIHGAMVKIMFFKGD
jgi:hypothetical protein